MKAAVRRQLLSQQTTGVGWDAVGNSFPTGLTLADDGRSFANCTHQLKGVQIACSGQLRLHAQRSGQASRRSLGLRLVQKISGTVDSTKAVRLKVTLPAGQTDFWCSISYAYSISVPASTFSDFVDPAQPSINITDSIAKPPVAGIVFTEGEDLGQIVVTYRF